MTTRFTAAEAVELDHYAQQRGLTRSAAVRDAVEKVVTTSEKTKKKGKKNG